MLMIKPRFLLLAFCTAAAFAIALVAATVVSRAVAPDGNDLPYTLTAQLPETPAVMTYYRTIPADPAEMAQIKDALGVKVPFEDVGSGKIARDATARFEYYKSGGSWFFLKPEKFYDPRSTPVALPSATEAEAMAKDFLSSNGLLPPEAYVVRTVDATFGRCRAYSDECTRVSTSRHVQFGFNKDGWPLIGPGAKMSVAFGEDGEVVMVFQAWRPLEKAGDTPVLSPEEAFERLKAERRGNLLEVGVPNASEITIDNVSPGYYVTSGHAPQEFVWPVYVFSGKVLADGVADDFEQIVPAVPGQAYRELGAEFGSETTPEPQAPRPR